MKKTPKNTIPCANKPPDLKPLTLAIDYNNASQASRESLNEFLNTMYKSATSAKMPDVPSYPTATSLGVGYSPVPPCQCYPKIIVDGVDVVKMLTDIAVVTGALREATSVANLDVVQHYSAERLAQFIVNDSKKIISGSGDAVAELTAWLLSKAD